MNSLLKLSLVIGFFGILVFAVVSSNVLQRYSYDIYTCKNATSPKIEIRFSEIKIGQRAEFKYGEDVKNLAITEIQEGIVSLRDEDLSFRLDRNTNRLYREINDLVLIFRCETSSFTM